MKQEPNIDIVDLNDGRFVLISENRFNFISDIKDGNINDAIREEIDIIKSENDKYEEVLFGPSIAFMPTLDCNLRCIYCYAKGGDDKIYLSTEMACRAIDNLIQNRQNYKNETISIYFVGGGEPFLGFECIENVCKYAKNHFEKVEIIAVSNGTFNERQRKWIINNNVALRISYDGLFHEIQRPFSSGKSSCESIKNNIRELSATDVPLTIQLTITNNSVESISESVEHIAELGPNYVKIEPVHYSILSRGGKDMVPKINLFVENFIKTIENILRNNLSIKIDNSFISRPTSGYYCGAGGGENITITPTGNITSCLEISREREKYSDVMMYGNISKAKFNIDESKKSFLKKLHFSNYNRCGNCNYKLICGGGCPMQAAWDNNDFFRPSDYNCTIHRLLLPKLFLKVYEDTRVLDVLFDNHIVALKC